MEEARKTLLPPCLLYTIMGSLLPPCLLYTIMGSCDYTQVEKSLASEINK